MSSSFSSPSSFLHPAKSPWLHVSPSTHYLCYGSRSSTLLLSGSCQWEEDTHPLHHGGRVSVRYIALAWCQNIVPLVSIMKKMSSTELKLTDIWILPRTHCELSSCVFCSGDGVPVWLEGSCWPHVHRHIAGILSGGCLCSDPQVPSTCLGRSRP